MLQSRLDALNGSDSDDDLEHALIVDLACSGWWSRVADEAVRLWSAARVKSQEAEARNPRPRDTNNAEFAGGPLESNAKRIAELLPSLGVLESDWCADRLRVFALRRRALDGVVEACSERDAVEERIREHAVDWTEFVYDEIRLPNRSSANEAMLCAREDGLSATEVAARARVELEHCELRRDGISSGIAAMLTGGISGDVLGPFDEDDGVHIVWLRDRRGPSMNDPHAREAATAELVHERLDRAAAGRALAVGTL